jgi:concanavalin A-like lectin/glucanase superfamily protein
MRARSNVKPPAGARVNWSNPVAAGLKHLIPFNEGGGIPQDLVTETRLQIGTPFEGYLPAWSLGPDGSAMDYSTAPGYGKYHVMPNTYLGRNNWTIHAVFMTADSTVWNGNILSVGNSWNDGGALMLLGTGRNSGTVHYSANTSWGYLTSNRSIVSNRWYSMTAVFDYTNLKYGLYTNGLVDINLLDAQTLNGSNTNNIYLGSGYDGFTGYTYNGRVGFVGVWGRVLRPDEVLSLHQNPWQTLQAPKSPRLYAAPAAGGSFNPAWARRTNSVIGGGLYVS